MQLIVVKYIQLICMTLSFSNQVNCDTLISNNEKEDRQVYKQTACAANCLDINYNMTLENCFNRCQNPSNINAKNLKQIYENLYVKFLCRDNSSLAFEIIQKYFDKINETESSSSELYSATNMKKKNNGYIYVIQLHQAHKTIEQQTILTNSSIVKIENLKSNTTYNITAAIVYANSEFSLISKNLQYSTLKTNYTPGIVRNISLIRYEENDKGTLKGIINWTPASDMTCYYNIIFYPSHGSYEVLPLFEIRDPKELYTYTLKPFIFNTNYTIGIRSKNIKDLKNESILKFYFIRTPSCLKWTNNNLTICPPLEPEGLQATEKLISINEFSINITWEKPIHEPDYYTVKILDLDLKSELYPNSLTFNVSKERSNLLIPTMTINGHQYEVHVTAYSLGGNSTSMIAIPLQYLQISPDHHVLKLVVAIILPLSFFAVISMLTFIMCHRRARTKRYKERCKYFEELEKKAPMDPKSNFEFSTKIISNDQLTQLQYDLEDKLFFNDQMELSRSDIKLLEVLGEGAFGLVRRGIIKIDEKNDKEVAVKMLKDHPSIDDFKGFRSEIEVMKSVGKHPNIVSIIGHCTKNIHDMMLLTEYCSLGNLLNFLRAEWNYINKIIYIQQKSMSIPNSPIELPNIINQQQQQIDSYNNKFNFDSSFVDKISLKYKNLNDNKSILIKNNIIDDNNDNNDDDNNDDPDSDNNTKIKLIVNNQGYDYNNRCTNYCKCHVNIIEKKLCLKSIDNPNSSMTTTKILNEIHISNNCECKYIQNNSLIIKNNSEDSCNNNNNNNDNENENNKKDFNENSQLFDPLTVENQGYYKFIEKNNDKYKNNNDDVNDNDNIKNENNVLFTKQEPLTSKDLLYIAKQIAMGMEFLSKSKVVHRDLAARNVLVCHDRTVKIADFGLSRDIYQENVYKKMGNGKLPIKWLALESMTHQLYTTQSDVWSFGVLLFEITTLGGTPYPAIPTNRLLQLLKSGYRMERPKNCGHSLYNLMSSCWKAVPSERPTFTEICQTLDELLANSPDHEIENLYGHEISKKIKSVSDDSYLKPI